MLKEGSSSTPARPTCCPFFILVEVHCFHGLAICHRRDVLVRTDTGKQRLLLALRCSTAHRFLPRGSPGSLPRVSLPEWTTCEVLRAGDGTDLPPIPSQRNKQIRRTVERNRRWLKLTRILQALHHRGRHNCLLRHPRLLAPPRHTPDDALAQPARAGTRPRPHGEGQGVRLAQQRLGAGRPQAGVQGQPHVALCLDAVLPPVGVLV